MQCCLRYFLIFYSVRVKDLLIQMLLSNIVIIYKHVECEYTGTAKNNFPHGALSLSSVLALFIWLPIVSLIWPI